jgi:transposase
MRFNEVQVLLALMVTREGLPIGYEAFSGSTYEGHTLIPAIKKLKEKYQIKQVVFVADSGMMSSPNLQEMQAEVIEYIVGARLKNRPKSLQDQVLDPENYAQVRPGYKLGKFSHNDQTFIVSYCEKRAKKDRQDRERAIENLRKKVLLHKSPKDYLSNQGYKKYLKIDADTRVTLNEDSIALAQRWDGLLGVCSNTTTLSAQEILDKYVGLWQVEEAFRINKHDLKIRPAFHWKPSRIKAHLAISFAAFSLVKFLTYRVKLQHVKLSPEVIRQTLIRVQTSILFDTSKKIRYALPSKLSVDAKKIYALMRVSRSQTPSIIQKL